jgi:hypothetical protein
MEFSNYVESRTPVGTADGTELIPVSKDGSPASMTAQQVANLAAPASLDASPSTKGIAKLYTATGSNTDGSMDQNSITTALATKQATLVSGTSIKTVNGASILGSGDIVVAGNVGNILYMYNNFI